MFANQLQLTAATTALHHLIRIKDVAQRFCSQFGLRLPPRDNELFDSGVSRSILEFAKPLRCCCRRYTPQRAIIVSQSNSFHPHCKDHSMRAQLLLQHPRILHEFIFLIFLSMPGCTTTLPLVHAAAEGDSFNPRDSFRSDEAITIVIWGQQGKTCTIYICDISTGRVIFQSTDYFPTDWSGFIKPLGRFKMGSYLVWVEVGSKNIAEYKFLVR